MRKIKVFLVALLAVVLFASVADATITVYKKHARTGGGVDALDGIDGNTLVDGDMCFVIESDWTYFFENDATGTAATGDVTPTTNPGTNVWKFKYKAATAPLIENDTTMTYSGRTPRLGLNSNTGVTLSGVSCFNRAITGVSNPARPATAGISVFLVAPANGENWWAYNETNTSSAGTTLYIIPGSGVTIISNLQCIGGSSKYVVSGDPLYNGLVFWAGEPGTSTYVVRAWGTPRVEAD